MTYRQLAEWLIFEGYFMPDYGWHDYERDLRWDWHIPEFELEQYAKEHGIELKEDEEI